jgi:hypothetical protein
MEVASSAIGGFAVGGVGGWNLTDVFARDTGDDHDGLIGEGFAVID